MAFKVFLLDLLFTHLMIKIGLGEYMDEIKIISNYLHHDLYRKSFNQLSKQIFRLDLESWYQAGYFQNRYIPYSYVHQEKIVSNVSISFMDMIIENQPLKAIQIGTVMTDRKYRNRGLAKLLLKHVLEQYEHYDLIYLFANDSVLNFYPKFGFQRIDEKRFTLEAKHVLSENGQIKILNPAVEQDRNLMLRLITHRKPVSKRLGVNNDYWPLSATYFDPQYSFYERYYLVEEDIIILARRKKGILNLYDVVSTVEFNLDLLIEKMVTKKDKMIEFHFMPDLKKYKHTISTAFWESDTLFVKSKIPLKEDILFPLTSHT